MSTFDIAIIPIVKIEGGYNNDPNDPGGATNYGLSLRYLNSDSIRFKSLLGITHLGNITSDDVKNITLPQAQNIYHSEWWNKYGFGKILNQDIATKVFYSAINMGVESAIICLQRAIRASNGIILTEDGIFGNETSLHVNICNPISLLAAYKSELAGHYRSLHNDNFIHGWLNRAYS